MFPAPTLPYPMIQQTEAIVLGARRFSESSKIVTLYTRESGRMGVMARGAMRPKNKFGASLQPLSYISAVIYIKEGRELQNISAAESVRRFPGLWGNLERMATGLEIVELVNASVHGEDRNEALFLSIVEGLGGLNDEHNDPALLSLWFMNRLAESLGYAVRTEGCGVCDEEASVAEEGGVVYSIPVGAPLCAEHREAAGYRVIARDSFSLLRDLTACEARDAGKLKVERKAAMELRDVLSSFLRYHVDGLRRLRAGEVSAALLS